MILLSECGSRSQVDPINMMELLFLRYEQGSFNQWFPMLTRSKLERKHEGKEIFLEVRSYFHEVKRKLEECVLEDIIIYNHRA